MSEPIIESLKPDPDVEAYEKPEVRFERITFSDGTIIKTEPQDVVVLVGPNNAGKSLALRELERFIGGTPQSLVITSAKSEPIGTKEAFVKFVRENTKVEQRDLGNGLQINGYGIAMSMGGNDLGSMWPEHIANFKPLFCLRISTETRITDSNPVDAIDYLTERPSHPIHLLGDDRVEQRLSEYFRRAFGQDLILYRGGRRSHLLVGRRLSPSKDEDRISATYLERLLDSTVALEEQGDGMRSFASVILHLLAPLTPSILLLDEPEAFLHPPQAKLLGEIIATERSNLAQLFVATHSPDVLHGLIGVAPEHLRVLRIQREGDVNRVKELDKELVQEISVDPLMRYSSVLSGVFHERVIICEADSDCMFYSSVLDNPEVHGDRYPDVLFIHANGKHRMAALSKALVSLGVPTDVIVDMDVLNNMDVFQRLVESLGGSWSTLQHSATVVKHAVEEQRPSLTVDEVKKGIRDILEIETESDQPIDKLKSDINVQFRMASPWEAIKSAGEQALPAGEAHRHFQEVLSHCKKIGLWIVPVGELEGFCKSVGGHGPAWVHNVMEEGNLKTWELEAARKFMHEVWMGRQYLPDQT